MKKIPTTLSQEVKDKYKIVSNSFRQNVKDDSKNRLTVEIGDVKQEDFCPQMKISRWGNTEEDNECNVSIRLIEDDNETPTIKTEGEKIKYIKQDRECHFYQIDEGEGASEFEVILKKKPKTNIIKFSVVDKDVDYFYQPELTQKEKDEGASRPENIEGSYAIYAKTPKTNWKGGKEYKCGKIGHIYRPKITDAVGNWAWEELHIENGILTITIPQEFLDNAVYPVSSKGLNFGYDTLGNSNAAISIRGFGGVQYVCWRRGGTYTGVAGTLDSLSVGLSSDSGETTNVSVLINDENSAGANSHDKIVLLEESKSIAVAKGWQTLTANDEILSVDDYILNTIVDPGGITGDENVYLHYDTVDTHNDYAEFKSVLSTNPYNNLKNEDPWTETVGEWDGYFSIYATYTPTAAGTLKSINGLALASIKSINGLAIASVKSKNGLTLN